MNTFLIDSLITRGQELYYGRAYRTMASECAENQKAMVEFAVSLLAESPTMYVRNAKKLLNKCGWFNATDIFRMQDVYSSKQKVWRHLNSVDCHVIQISDTKYYRALSTGIVSMEQLQKL